MKKCKAPDCNEHFVPHRTTQQVCSPACAIRFSQEKSRIAQRKKDKKRLAELRPIKHWLDATQRVFNMWVRLRDKDEPCISCGRLESFPRWEAGHFISVGASRGSLRFEPTGCHKQCHDCNHHQSGNQLAYRRAMVRKYGEKHVQWLESQTTVVKKWTREELADLRKYYNEQIRILKNDP